MNLEETKRYGIDEEADYCGGFFIDEYLDDNLILNERNASFKTDRGKRIDIYIKESCGNEPHIHLRDQTGNICRVRLREAKYQRDAYERNPLKRWSLDKKELKAFNNFMHSIIPGTEQFKGVGGISQWEELCIEWNRTWAGNNPKKSGGLVEISKGCPDYLAITEPTSL